MRAQRAALMTDRPRVQAAVPSRHQDVEANQLLRFLLTGLLVRNGQEVVRVLSGYRASLTEREAQVPADPVLGTITRRPGRS